MDDKSRRWERRRGKVTPMQSPLYLVILLSYYFLYPSLIILSFSFIPYIISLRSLIEAYSVDHSHS